MANNRMFLLHRPTGLAAPLAKRMGWGWWAKAPDAIGPAIARLFRVLENEHDYAGTQDDFCIALEDADGASLADENWLYTTVVRDDGLVVLALNSDAVAVTDGSMARADNEAYLAERLAERNAWQSSFNDRQAKNAARIECYSDALKKRMGRALSGLGKGKAK